MSRYIHSKALVAAAALLLVAGIGVGVYAQGDGPEGRGPLGHGGPGRRALFGLAQLDLTDAQREQVREVMQRHRADVQEAGKRVREAFQAQRAAIESTPVNEGLIRSTAQTLANAQTDMALLQARIHTEVWSLLTPEQQEKAKQLKAQRQARFKQRAARRPQRQEG
jgi:periplasmic protein CpxP/Spy